MALPDHTWREHPMVVGCTYVARRTFGATPGQVFVIGKRYTLRRVGHSHQDACTIFTFEEESSATPQAWWWPDDAQVESCHTHFEAAASPER